LRKLKHHIIYSCILAILFLPLFSCQKHEVVKDESPVIAKAGKHTLTLNQALGRIPAQLLETDSLGALNSYKRQWVRERILVDEATRRGIRDLHQFNQRLNEYADQLATQLLLEQIYNSGDLSEVTRDEAIDYYAANRTNFVLQERHFRFHHMITETLNNANRARSELLNGEPWELIVERYAVDKTHSLRNSDTFFPESSLIPDVPAIRQILPRMGLTEVSPVRQAGDRYHFVQLLDVRKLGEAPEPEWAISRIKEWLTLERRRKAMSAFEQNLIRQAEANREIQFFD
jgi:hypothetical protein